MLDFSTIVRCLLNECDSRAERNNTEAYVEVFNVVSDYADDSDASESELEKITSELYRLLDVSCEI
jgi:hypothetical protein